MASTATLRLPSVPFLNPTGHDSPDASSRCTWLSVVRAPIAPHATVAQSQIGCMVSLGDLVRTATADLEADVQFLQDYILRG